MYSGRRYRSADMQHDLFRSDHDLELRSNFQHDLLRSKYSSFDASWREKQDTGKMNALLHGVKGSFFPKTFFFIKTTNFNVFALWRLNR